MRTSILMSVYKGERFIRQQLDSIINQTRPADEFIIIDDCSPDDGATIRIVEEYRLKYPYIKLYKNERNLGWASSFMRGLDYISGEIVFFADQDDVWELDKIKKMTELFDNTEINGIISNVQNVDVNLKSNNQSDHSGELLSNHFTFDKHFIYPKGVGAAMAFRRSIITQYKDLWVEGFGHDRFFQVVLIMFDKLYFLDLPLIKHRNHGDNATAGKSFEIEKRIRTLNGNIEFINKIKNVGLWAKLSEDKKQLIEKYIKYAIARKTMLEKQSILRWISMPFYDLSYYPTNKTWFGDLKGIVKRG